MVPDVLLALTCPVCGVRGGAPCPPCAAGLRPAPPVPPPLGVDRCLALFAYEGAGRELVTKLKYRNHRGALAGLAAALAALVRGLDFDVVTWPPTTAGRRRERGFDQAELLARGVARQLGVPSRRLLARGPGLPQTGRSRGGRQEGPDLHPRGRAPPRALVVDDVVTTGATLRAAALALRGAGAEHVVAVAVARTPLRAPRRG